MISAVPVMTNAGESLMIRGISGENLMFTRFVLGSGVYSGDPAEQTAVIAPEMSVGIHIEDGDNPSGYINLAGAFDNADVETGFRWRELGIYCSGEKHLTISGGSKTVTLADKPGVVYRALVDGSPVTISGYVPSTGVLTFTTTPASGSAVTVIYPDPEEVLYAYANDGDNAGMLSAGSSASVVQQVISILVAVGRAEHVTAMITESELYASKAEFNAHVQRTDNPHGVTKSQIGLGSVLNVSPSNMVPVISVPSALAELTSTDRMSAMMGKLQLAIRSLLAHMSAVNPHALTAASLGAAAESHTHNPSTALTSAVPISKGGTGAATAAGARSALGITPANIGAAESTHTHTLSSLGAAAESHTHNPSTALTSAVPISKGGTGATTAAGALTALGIVYSAAEPQVIEGGIWLKPIE